MTQAPDTNFSSSEEPFLRAVQCHLDGRIDEAEGLYGLIADDSPHRAQADFMLHILSRARTLASSKRKTKARSPLEPSRKQRRAERELEAGITSHERGDLEAAEAHYQRALKDMPRNGTALHLMGVVCFSTGRSERAEQYFRRAVAAEPSAFVSWMYLGIVLQSRDQDEDAIDAYEHSIALRPDNVESIGHLARLAEERNDPEGAKKMVGIGLAMAPEQPLLNLVAARLARRAKGFDEARDRLSIALERDPDPMLRTKMYFELGKVCDLAGLAGDAFAAFENANQLKRASATKAGFDARRYVSQIRDLKQTFTPDWIKSWAKVPSTERPSPVFMVGFPRSGTTLLDQMLSGHPDIEVIEERPVVTAIQRYVSGLADGYPAALASLTDDQVVQIREAYFERLDSFRETNRTFVVDKLPLNLVQAGPIHRIFPDAKFVLSLRHPLDVCLSCFMQDFAPSDSMANFDTLADTAALYDLAMGLWLDYAAILPMQFHQIRYEDMVDDLEAAVRPLVTFLGLEWDDQIKDFVATAAGRGRLRTPSYDQVSQPMYDHARYRWSRYAEYLEPIKATVQPFIDRFGYGEDEPDR